MWKTKRATNTLDSRHGTYGGVKLFLLGQTFPKWRPKTTSKKIKAKKTTIMIILWFLTVSSRLEIAQPACKIIMKMKQILLYVGETLQLPEQSGCLYFAA